jgi:putative sterol carrier protein
MMTIEGAMAGIEKRMAHAGGLHAKVLFDFGDDGKIFADTTVSPPVLSQEDGDADLTLVTSLDTFEKILAGEQDPNLAVMFGKLKIRGSMGLAMKLGALLEG